MMGDGGSHAAGVGAAGGGAGWGGGGGTGMMVDGGGAGAGRRRFCHRASLDTFKRFAGDTVWCPIETAAYDLEWPVVDLATQLFGSDGMSNG